MSGKLKPVEEVAERIVAAAIYQDGVTYTGPHHHQIIRYLAALTGKSVRGSQGFITSANRFVDRIEARYIAYAACQADLQKEDSGTPLMSEQLWHVTDWALIGLTGPRAYRKEACAPLVEALENAINGHDMHCRAPKSNVNEDGSKNIIWCDFENIMRAVLAQAREQGLTDTTLPPSAPTANSTSTD